MDPQLRSKLATMHADLAQVYLDAGYSNEAIEQLRRVTDLCPDLAAPRVKLGSIYHEQKDLHKAREHFAAACAADPSHAPARVLLGITLYSMGLIDDAIAEWNTALDIEPDNTDARNFLRMADAKRIATGNHGGPVPAFTPKLGAPEPAAKPPMPSVTAAKPPVPAPAGARPSTPPVPAPAGARPSAPPAIAAVPPAPPSSPQQRPQAPAPKAPAAPSFNMPRQPAASASGSPVSSRPKGFLSYGPPPVPQPAGSRPSLPAAYEDDPEDEPTIAKERISHVPEPKVP
jgi:tetratricopeptide (TPR) repeat protein